MSEIEKGGPTGRLDDKGRMMEVKLHTVIDGVRVDAGTRWIPVTDIMRDSILNGRPKAVSMGAVVMTDDMCARVDGNSSSFGYEYSPDSHAPDYKSSAASTSEDAARARAIRPGTYLPPGVTLTPPEPEVTTEEEEAFSAIHAAPPSEASKTGAEPPKDVSPVESTSRRLERLYRLAEACDKLPSCIPRPNLMREWCAIMNIDLMEMTQEIIDDRMQRRIWSVKIDSATNKVVGFTPRLIDVLIPGESKKEITGTTTITEALRASEQPTSQINTERRKPEHSGGDVNYYSVRIDHPKRSEREPYTFEVEDLIQALNLDFHEGTVLKSLVRSATERELGLVKQGGDAIRDAEKMIHSSQEILRARKLKKDKQ